jgi:hypothetical protein
MTPASLAIIEATFQPADRTRAIGTWAGFSGVSAAIAPFFGGWLLEAGSWRAIFLINVPVAAVTARVTRRHVPESRDTPASGRADWPGALAGAAALAATTYAILVLPDAGVTSPGFAVAAALAVTSAATFAVTERRGSHPMLPPTIFRPAQFRAANAVTFVVNGALGGFAFVFIPALEIIVGYSPVVAGSALVPVTVVTVLLSGASAGWLRGSALGRHWWRAAWCVRLRPCSPSASAPTPATGRPYARWPCCSALAWPLSCHP